MGKVAQEVEARNVRGTQEIAIGKVGIENVIGIEGIVTGIEGE